MQIEPEYFTIEDYLHHTFSCECGRSHHTDVEKILISQGALERVPEAVEELGYHHVFLVSDYNTYQAAGERVEKLLRDRNQACTSYVIPRKIVVSDEHTLGELLVHFNPECDLIIGVGTGTINDMCKFLSYQMKMEYMIIASAPSMDGFASVGAALIVNNLKTTYNAHVPKAIIGDVDILAKAPMNMIAAGVADILGKYTCLCDWHLSNLVNGEYFCPVIERMVRYSLKKMMEQVKNLKERTPETIQTVMESLVLTGIAMSFVGNSRPASGCEHHMSHYWEMKFLFEGRPAVLHGTKVGVGTMTAIRLYQKFMESEIDYEEAVRRAEAFDFAEWSENMKRTYGAAADGVIANEKTEQKNDPEEVKKRLVVIREKMGDIRRTVSDLVPKEAFVKGILEDLDAPVNPLELGIDCGMVSDSIEVAKEVRDRYTLLQLLWDLGILKTAAEETAASFQKEIEK